MNRQNDNSALINSIDKTRIDEGKLDSIVMDLLPSSLYVIIITVLLICVDLSQSFSTLLISYNILFSFFIFKGLIYILLIKKNKILKTKYQIFSSVYNIILYVVYYTLIIFGYIIFKNSPKNLIVKNLILVGFIFLLVLIGVINMISDLLTLISIIIKSIFMICLFKKDSKSFYENVGKDPSLIINFRSIKAREEENKECLICLESINKGDNILILKCGHYFHETCIKSWLIMKFSCPTCRKNNIL